ncbi:methyltransferase domain-containing protein [Mesorhizobium waimense]|uniref:Methyltransferase domain-containing protein n=1 Tax=Mesorhizobium waimense TaxID=1300307 RepID=A0A3A5KT06_9HYPH|nr:methyltransferase domain-containing protein [Mesorhizobium waimense]RJT36340.1 methyltransferase domain-containing protein [Mesorhizobium waimense]
MNRFDLLRQSLDKKTMVGIEIGPFYSPIAPKEHGWQTTVIDFQEVMPDIVLRGEPLDTLALARNRDGYDYFIASHVIEHTPDLLSFFQQVSRLLRKGGIVSLAVPDMRKCFDVLKPVSSIREVLAAYREKRVRHTPETLLEAANRLGILGGRVSRVGGKVANLPCWTLGGSAGQGGAKTCPRGSGYANSGDGFLGRNR